jgi:hypothetical protein
LAWQYSSGLIGACPPVLYGEPGRGRQQRAPADDAPSRRRQAVGPSPEDVAADRVDALENAQPAVHHAAQFEADAAA